MDECVCTLTPQATCTLNFARIQVVHILLLYSKTRHGLSSDWMQQDSATEQLTVCIVHSFFFSESEFKGVACRTIIIRVLPTAVVSNTLAQVLSNCIAFQYFILSVSGGKSSLSGGWSQPLPTSMGRTLNYACTLICTLSALLPDTGCIPSVCAICIPDLTAVCRGWS